MFEVIANRPIRIAILGYGQIAKKHIAAIQQFPNDLQLTGICDANPVTVKNAMHDYKVDAYSSLGEMLDQANIDIVSVCTPTGLHAEQTIAIAQSQRHVICEKPLATRWQDGVEMVRVCDKNKVHLFVVKQNRANPTLQLLKQAIELNRFGKIYQININVFWTRPPEYYAQSPWRGSWKLDGGALMNQASHYVDLLDWLFGPVEKIHAMTATLARKIESEDSAVLNIRWRNGALGSMNVSMLTYPKNLEASLTVLGEKGTVKIGGVAINQIESWEFADIHSMDEQINKASEETTLAIGYGHKHYYENVIQVLRGHATPITDGHEGIKTLELLTAAYISAREDKTISLPLEH